MNGPRARVAAWLPAIVVFIAAPAHARPTHSPVEPLAVDAKLETAPYFQLDLGRTWTYRDSLGNRYRHVIAGAGDLVDKAGKRADWLRRRDVYQ